MYLKSVYPELPEVQPQNVHYLLLHREEQKRWTNHVLLIDAMTGKERSYCEFYDRVMDGATALGSPIAYRGFGLRGEDGEIVGVLSENCLDYITLLHSLFAITTPFALFSAYSTPFELVHALHSIKVTRMFVHVKFLSFFQRVAKDVGFPDSNIYILEGYVEGRHSFDEMIQHVRKERISRLAVRHAEKDTLAYLVFSSGTSGLPKAVMISHGNLCFTLMQLATLRKAQTQANTSLVPTPVTVPVVLGFLPLHHSYGLLAFVFNLLCDQKTLVLMPKWDMDIALKLISKYRITHLPLVPSLVHQLVNSHKVKLADLSSLEFYSCSSAYLPDSLKNKLVNISAKNVDIFEGYGMSEMTMTAIAKPLEGILGDRVKTVPGSTGILMSGVEARILHEDGTAASLNEPGELWLRSGGVAMGYHNNERATRETFVDGWLKTGDQFSVDKDGTFYFHDRIKDTLKVSGTQVSPTEIENVLLAHPENLISDAAVAGVSGGRTADEKIPHAWVILNENGIGKGEAAVVRALHTWIRDNLSKHKWLRGGIEVVNEIPKSHTGKVLRRVLQDGYNQRMKKYSSNL